MTDDEIERLIDWYYRKGGTYQIKMIEFICSLCAQRGITTYLCEECGVCPRHEKHSNWCKYK